MAKIMDDVAIVSKWFCVNIRIPPTKNQRKTSSCKGTERSGYPIRGKYFGKPGRFTILVVSTNSLVFFDG
jgi:hypothetical protein